MLPTEDVQRQVAIVPVVAVEEPTFLLAMQRVVGAVEVQDDLRRCFAVGLEKHLHQHPVYRRGVQRNLLVALVFGHLRGRQL